MKLLQHYCGERMYRQHPAWLARSPSVYLLNRMDCVCSSRTILTGSGPSVLLALLEHRNSYALFTSSNMLCEVCVCVCVGGGEEVRVCVWGGGEEVMAV